MNPKKLNEMAENLLNCLDRISREFEPYDYGLPLYDKETKEIMMSLVVEKLQAALSLPEIKAMKEALESIANIDISENPPDLIWLNKWRNDTKLKAQKALADMGEVMK